MRSIAHGIAVVGLALVAAARLEAQPLGTFRWQLQPYCNVVTVTATQVGVVYRLEGTDDQCGAAAASSAIGTAFLNPDGSIGLGLNIVAAPGGEPHPVAARLALSSLSGTWSDSQRGGAFVFSPGPAPGGAPRPLPTAAPPIPAAFRLQADGGFLAGGTFQVGTWPVSGPGVRLLWSPAKAAIRAGRTEGPHWDESNVGSESAAFNHNTTASGPFSLAINDGSVASGAGSVAMGRFTLAAGAHSLAAGLGTVAGGAASLALGLGTQAIGVASLAGGSASTAQGAYSVAIGNNVEALGAQSTAFGANTIAAGPQSLAAGSGSVASGRNSVALGTVAQAAGEEAVAIGTRVSAGGPGSVVLGTHAVALNAATGSFLYADRSTTADIVSFTPNDFIVRAAGGVTFFSDAAMTTGVRLSGGGNSWSSVSDVNAKENFRDVSGEELLDKLSGVPIREWNYTSQDASIRHMGPTAQDFRAAFGLGDSPLRINTVDADGVALAALKALEARTRSIGDDQARIAAANARTHDAHQALMRESSAAMARLARLEGLVDRR